MDLVKKTHKLISKEALVEEGDRVLLGLSGGIDSTTLLYVLREIQKDLSFELAAAHVNHLLRQEESMRDERFAEETAAQLGVPFFLKRADVKGYALSHGLSLQHAGRDIRYLFFEETAGQGGYTKIAVAHNLDDQVETFLLRLLKGTGIRGLSSIPLMRGRIIRPFLHTYRAEIASYASSKSIPFVSDSSNTKTVYERNYIRHNIIPSMEKLNPAFREKIISLLFDLTGVNRSFDEKKRSFLESNVKQKPGRIVIPIAELKTLDRETLFRVLSDVVTSLAPHFLPLREHIKLIEKIVNSAKPNLNLHLPSSLVVKKIYNDLSFDSRPQREAVTETFDLKKGRNTIVPLGISMTVASLKKPPLSYPDDPFTAHFDLDKTGSLAVRTFRAGDRFCPLGMKEPVKVKDFFISRKVPLDVRRHLPLLLSDDRIIWIAGQRIDDRYKIDEKTQAVLRVSVKFLSTMLDF